MKLLALLLLASLPCLAQSRDWFDLMVLQQRAEQAKQEQAQKRAALERVRVYIAAYNALAERLQKCFVEDYKAQKHDAKRCGGPEIHRLVDRLLKAEAER